MRAKEVKPGALKLFQVVSLVLFCGLELACGSEDPPQPRTTTNQKGKSEQASNQNLPQTPGSSKLETKRNLAIEDQFVVKVKDSLLEKLREQKTVGSSEPLMPIISSEAAMKIWRDHWLELNSKKATALSGQSYIAKISPENLNDLSKRKEALNKVIKIIEETNLISSQPKILRALDLLGVLVLKTRKGEKAEQLANDLFAAIKNAMPGILNGKDKEIIVEQNHKLELHQDNNEPVPNDRLLYIDLPGHAPPPKLSQLWGLDKIRMKEAWEYAKIDWKNPVEGKTILAVIDTGVMAKHPDLEPNMWINLAELNGVKNEDDDNPKNGYKDDIHGANIRAVLNPEHCGNGEIQNEGNPFDDDRHGTHVAGVVAARGHNDDPPDDKKSMIGVVGNGLVKIMALKIFCQDSERHPDGSYAHAIEAIKYANQMGALVVNASWGLLDDAPDKREILKTTIREAGKILFVVSAGNRGNLMNTAALNIDDPNDKNKIYPASFGSELDNVLTVAATVLSDDFKADSLRGPKSVKMAAPGDTIFSTSFNINPPHEPTIDTQGGTSVAAPFVAGCAAFIQAVRQSRGMEPLDPSDLRKILITHGDPSTKLDGGMVEGKRLNCHSALVKAVPPVND